MSITLSLPDGFVRSYPPERPPRGESCWLLFRGEDVVVSECGPTVEVLRATDLETLVDAPVTELAYLGLLDGTPCIAGAIPSDAHLAEGLRTVDLRSLFDHLDPDLYAVAGYGYQIVRWRRASRFCAFCGSATEAVEGEWGRRCGACNHVAYPHVSLRVALLSVAAHGLQDPAKCPSSLRFQPGRSPARKTPRHEPHSAGRGSEAPRPRDEHLELGARPEAPSASPHGAGCGILGLPTGGTGAANSEGVSGGCPTTAAQGPLTLPFTGLRWT